LKIKKKEKINNKYIYIYRKKYIFFLKKKKKMKFNNLNKVFIMGLLSIGVVRSEPVVSCYTNTLTDTYTESDYYKVIYQCPKTLPVSTKTLPFSSKTLPFSSKTIPIDTNAIPTRTVTSKNTCVGYADKVSLRTIYEVKCQNVKTYSCYDTKCCQDTPHNVYREVAVPCQPMQIMERRNDSATKISITKIPTAKTTTTRFLKSLSNYNDPSYKEEISNPNLRMRVGLDNQLTCYTRESYISRGPDRGKVCNTKVFDYSLLSTTFTTRPPVGYTIVGLNPKAVVVTAVKTTPVASKKTETSCRTESNVIIPLNTSMIGYATTKHIKATTSTRTTKRLPFVKSTSSTTRLLKTINGHSSSSSSPTSTSSTSSKTLPNLSINKENIHLQTVTDKENLSLQTLTYTVSEYALSNQQNEYCTKYVCSYNNYHYEPAYISRYRRIRCPVMSFEGREDIVNPYYVGGPDLAFEDYNQYNSIFPDKVEILSNTTTYETEKIFTENAIVDHTLYCIEKQYYKTSVSVRSYCSTIELPPKEITTDVSLTTTEDLLPTSSSIMETETTTEIEADTVTEMEETSLPTEFITETETKSTVEIETESAEIETETESTDIETESTEIETESKSTAEIDTEDETVSITTEPTSTQESCSPVVVTITEKKKITITEKETVTVTVNKEDDEKEQCAPKWGQCGGINYHGPTCCSSGSRCVQYDSYYSQCV
jgi:hypothetical protein